MDIVGRSLPYSLEAEQAVLGSAIVNQGAISRVMERLKTEDFYLEQHKTIFTALSEMFATATPVDIVTLSSALGDRLEKIGGVSYLGTIAGGITTTENLKYYIDIVSGKAVLRNLIEAASEIVNMGYEEKEEVSVIMDAAEQRIFNILQNRGYKGLYHIRDVLPAAVEKMEQQRERAGKMVGLTTGFRDLDAITAGLQNSDLLILAARPGIGKTSFALNIAKNVAVKENVPVAIFSLEMSKEQLVNRLLWSQALIDSEKVRRGDLSLDDMKRIAHALGTLAKAPIYIDDTPGISISEIRAKCRQLKLKQGLGMIVIDYLQLMQGRGRSESRQQEISEISRSLKILAKELDVPVLTLSQLSRAAEKREDKRPQLSDLRESGAIEQDADIVMFLSRKNESDAKEGEGPIDLTQAECILAKHRNGSTGTINLIWRGEFTTFMDCDNRY